jgi:AraC-like DNA-binding protein
MTEAIVPVNPEALRSFQIINVLDPREMDANSMVSSRLPADSAVFHYHLRDRALLRSRFESPITIITMRQLGDMSICHVADRFGTEIDIGGDGLRRYCFNGMFGGRKTLIQNGRESTASGHRGLVYRGLPGTRVLTSDGNARQNLWIEASALERALETMLGAQLREPLDFEPDVDWSRGLAASLKGQIDFLMRELARSDGVVDNPVALASMTDLMLSLALRGLPHNYSERLANARWSAVPAYVRRAEEFMQANAGPIRMEHVARSAGCSIRTLSAVFRRFRDTTPLAALHAIRLDKIHAELKHEGMNGSVAEIARRYGFTNIGRFVAAYRRRFGESPTLSRIVSGIGQSVSRSPPN